MITKSYTIEITEGTDVYTYSQKITYNVNEVITV